MGAAGSEPARLIVDNVAAFRTGNDVGMRIVNERQFDRLVGYLEATKGEVAVGGHSDRDSLTIEPTVIVDPDPDEPAMTDEIFGPILPVIEVDSVDQAIRFAERRGGVRAGHRVAPVVHGPASPTS